MCTLLLLAVTCLPVSFNHVTNSSDVSVGAVIEVACPDGQVFDGYGDISNMTSQCLSSASWYPAITDCLGIPYLLLAFEVTVRLEY